MEMPLTNKMKLDILMNKIEITTNLLLNQHINITFKVFNIIIMANMCCVVAHVMYYEYK